MTEGTEPPRPRGGTGARAAWLVGAGIFLSRIAGLVRESVFSFYFGNSAIADAWSAAWRTPNLIQVLLGEGTLSASFIPVYARFLEEGREEEAGRFASFNWMSVPERTISPHRSSYSCWEPSHQ